MAYSTAEIDLLKRYPKAIYHLRTQLLKHRLMPIFGAGLSRPLDLPDWERLIDRLSQHVDVSGDMLNIQKSSHTSRTQMLFQHFRRNYLSSFSLKSEADDLAVSNERMVHARWIQIVHECLYQSAKTAQEHPYLHAFLPIVEQAPLTVNYNFDDCIQELLDIRRGQNNPKSSYETIWDPTVQFRNSSAVIYHPNGFLPRRIERGPSESIVFAEDSFADQLIDAQRGHYSTLLSHMFRFTGLLIGLSLEDATLKHLLRQCLHSNPGHVHYYLAYLPEDDTSHPNRKAATLDSNFETYNLVTLYLKGSEFQTFANLLTLAPEDFARIIDDAGLPKSFTFYLSGAVGTGKTSALSRFKSLNTVEEWIDPKPALLHQAADTLTDLERQEVDQWINRQFRQKSLLIQRFEGTVNLIDRSPIDPLAFAKRGETKARVEELRRNFERKKGKSIEIAEGEVILIVGNPGVLHTRVQQRHKRGSVDYINGLQERFKSMWRSAGPGVRCISGIDLPLHVVVKKIARIVHFGDYQPIDMSEYLRPDLAEQIDATSS